MATRSTIALEFADGTVEQVYCHWDGYLAHNGKMLLEHYSNPFILRDLIDLGGLSSLRTTIGTKHAFSQFDLPKEEVEAFVNLTENMCTFYARDRGEKLVAHKFVDFQDYLAHHQYEEYEYILRKDGNWYVQCHDDPYVTLKSAIADEQDRIAQEETAE
jgi:hypothetical protein